MPSTLMIGSRGTEVLQLQTALNKSLPTMLPALVVDGVFGQKTMSGVQEFQRRLGLDGDGIVGPKTWAALQERGGSPNPANTTAELDSFVASAKRALLYDPVRTNLVNDIERSLVQRNQSQSGSLVGFAPAIPVVLIVLVVLVVVTLLLVSNPAYRAGVIKLVRALREAIGGRMEKAGEIVQQVREFWNDAGKMKTLCEQEVEEKDPEEVKKCRSRVGLTRLAAAYEGVKSAIDFLISSIYQPARIPKALKNLGKAVKTYVDINNELQRCLKCPETPYPDIPDLPIPED